MLSRPNVPATSALLQMWRSCKVEIIPPAANATSGLERVTSRSGAPGAVAEYPCENGCGMSDVSNGKLALPEIKRHNDAFGKFVGVVAPGHLFDDRAEAAVRSSCRRT